MIQNLIRSVHSSFDWIFIRVSAKLQSIPRGGHIQTCTSYAHTLVHTGILFLVFTIRLLIELQTRGYGRITLATKSLSLVISQNASLASSLQSLSATDWLACELDGAVPLHVGDARSNQSRTQMRTLSWLNVNFGKVNLETCWPAVYLVGYPTRAQGLFVTHMLGRPVLLPSSIIADQPQAS